LVTRELGNKSQRLGGLLVLLSLAACTSDASPPAACLQPLAACTPTIEPTYTAIYPTVFAASCGGSGTSCHGQQGMQAGLGLYDMNLAYDDLLGKADGRARVLPGKPECSILMERLESQDPSQRMPLLAGAPLDKGYRCAIQQWIAAGAPR
jgi:Planctomycete cytochrome C